METIRKYEPMTRESLRMIAASLGPIQSMLLKLGDVDIDAGAGVIGPNKKCLWTRDGRRISFDISDGGFIGDISNEPDPARPATKGGAR